MRNKTKDIPLAILIGLMIGVVLMFTINQTNLFRQTANTSNKKDTPAVLFWYDPMFPDTKFDKPGTSPFMDMDLVPKYAEEENGHGHKDGIYIDPIQTQNLGVRTEAVVMGQLRYHLNVPATLAFNNYQYAMVQSRANGFIEHTYPLTIGDKVTRGDPLVTMTTPEWADAQSEYLLLNKQEWLNKQTYSDKNRLLNTNDPKSSAFQGLKERLRLSGMPDELLKTLLTTKKVQTNVTLKAPIDGILTQFDAINGMNVSKNNILATIQGVNPIWVNMAVPESSIYLLDEKTDLSIKVNSFPSRTFKADKMTVLSHLDPLTRTVQVRLQVNNDDGLLKPGMNASVQWQTVSQPILLIPMQSLIDVGHEQRVITLDKNGRFVPKIVKVNQTSEGKAGIISGLSAGELVVTSGQFLIDSEANIAGALDKMRQLNVHEADRKERK